MAPRTLHGHELRADFGEPARATAALRELLSAGLVSRVDWQSMRLAPGSWVSSVYANIQSDLLYSIQLDSKPAFLYLLLDERSPDGEMMAHALRNAVMICDDLLRDNPHLPVPAVIPVVLRRDEQRWQTLPELTEAFDLSSDQLADLRSEIAEFRPFFERLPGVDDRQLRERISFGVLMLQAMLEDRAVVEQPSELQRYREAVEAAIGAKTGMEALSTIMLHVLPFMLRIKLKPPSEKLLNLFDALAPS